MNRKILFGSALSVLVIVSVIISVIVFYPELSTVNIQCNYDDGELRPKTLVRSHEGDLGCVDVYTALHLTCEGWSILNKNHISHIDYGSCYSDYQIDDTSHTKDPDTNYVWIQRSISQCWTSPWTASNQTVQDYFADLDITVLKVKSLNGGRDIRDDAFVYCDGCSCYGGSLLFLIQESDYDKMPEIYQSS